MHAELAPVLEAARKKGVDLGLSDLKHYGGSDWEWDYKDIDSDAARLIVTGALAGWLAGQGWSVHKYGDEWFRNFDGRMNQRLRDATDFLSALLAATLAQLDELPDKPAAAEAEAASGEGGR